MPILADLESTAPAVGPSSRPAGFLMGLRSLLVRLRAAVLIFLAVFGLSLVLARHISQSVTHEREAKLIERESIMAATTAETISANLGRVLGQQHSIPMVLANEPSLIATLQRFGPEVQPSPLSVAARRAIWQGDPEFRALARRFEGIIEQAGISQIWVTNAAADCFVSAGFPEAMTSTGVNYVKRFYFQAARQGRQASQFAVGATTNIPGLFFSSPVMAEGRFLGVVVVKLELPRLAPLIATSDSFITDENGVVILARNPDLLMKTVPEAKISSLPGDVLENRYRRSTFEALAFLPAGKVAGTDLVQRNGEIAPCVLKKRELPGEIVTVNVLRPLDELAQLHADSLWLFALLSLTGALLASLAAGATVFLRHNRETHKELSLLANTDTLTGCANRRSFLAALEREWRFSTRYGALFSAISLDLDYFKMVNDRFGHAGGDLVLCHFVELVGKTLRPCDTLGRLGGEEFAILLPQTPAAGAAAVAERVLAAIRANPARIGAIHYEITFSAGISEWRLDDGECLDMLKRADRALYQAKSLGRDRAVSAD